MAEESVTTETVDSVVELLAHFALLDTVELQAFARLSELDMSDLSRLRDRLRAAHMAVDTSSPTDDDVETLAVAASALRLVDARQAGLLYEGHQRKQAVQRLTASLLGKPAHEDQCGCAECGRTAVEPAHRLPSITRLAARRPASHRPVPTATSRLAARPVVMIASADGTGPATETTRSIAEIMVDAITREFRGPRPDPKPPTEEQIAASIERWVLTASGKTDEEMGEAIIRFRSKYGKAPTLKQAIAEARGYLAAIVAECLPAS